MSYGRMFAVETFDGKLLPPIWRHLVQVQPQRHPRPRQPDMLQWENAREANWQRSVN